MRSDGQRRAEGAGAAVCPECGLEAGARARPRGSRVLRIGAIARYGIIIVALVVLGCKNYQSVNTFKSSILGGGASFEPVDPPISFGELRNIANEPEAGARLAEAVRAFRPRGLSNWPGWRWRLLSVSATFRPRGGEVWETRDRGWPGNWWSEYAVTQYEDVFARSGPVARDWGSRRRGDGAVAASSGALTTRDVRSNFLYREVLVSVLLWLLVSWLAASLVLLAYGARTRAVPARRVRLRAWAAAFAVAAVLMIGLALSTRREVIRVDCHMLTASGDRGRFGWELEEVALPYTLRDLATASDVRRLAREITSGIRGGVPDDAVLHLGAVPSYAGSDAFTEIGWPERMISTWSTEVQPSRPDDTTGVPGLDVDVSWSPSLFRSSVPSIIWYSHDPSTGSIHGRAFTVYAFNVAPILVMFAAFWILSGAALRVGSWRVVRRRVRDQRCVACGYSLAGLAAPQR